MIEYDDPAALADLVVRAARPLLIGLDVDGVLAPIVSHADDARLLNGISDALRAVDSVSGIDVAVVSGRSIEDLERFDFGPEIEVVGSHGMQIRGREMNALSATEADHLRTLADLAEQARDAAGNGAWVEYKPLSVALHVREADDAAGISSLSSLQADAAVVEGTTIKPGSAVLELFTRYADKGDAMKRISTERDIATTVFVGDDVTDEDVFAVLRDLDIGIKVGADSTIAESRLPDPEAVLALLSGIATGR